MGLLAVRHSDIVRTGELPPGTATFVLKPGYYNVAYIVDGDPEQSEASKLTIAWANTYKDDIEVVSSYLGGTARFAGIRTKRELPYPVNGKWLCLATSSTVQDPITGYENCTRIDTAQYETMGELASQKADIAQGGVTETHKLANAAAVAAGEALSEDSWIPKWVPWIAGGAVVVGGIWGLARLVRG